jgi:hypothetical protein
MFMRDGREGVVAQDVAQGVQLLSLACTRGCAQACVEAQQAPTIPIPQYCSMAQASFGPLTVGSPVVLGYHTPWGADANWADEMGRWVGARTYITSLEGVDSVGCPVVRVAADGGQYYWRIRNMTIP